MSPSLLALLRFLDDLHERVERTWWGAVVTDSRFPLLWEANYAAVDAADPDLSLGDVRAALHPALREAGATHEHLWVMQHEATVRLVRDLGAEGHELHWDDLMRHSPRAPVAAPAHRVEEVAQLDDAFWQRERRALREFGITDPAVAEQLLRRQRDVAAPAGKRWFTVPEDGRVAGIGSMFVLGPVAYVDDVVTFPPFRRRGVARSIVGAMLREARAAEAAETFLFTDQPGPVRLYEGLGFEVVQRVATSLAPLPEAREPEEPTVKLSGARVARTGRRTGVRAAPGSTPGRG
jgi:GNAT superfamily N-acetyltransferase